MPSGNKIIGHLYNQFMNLEIYVSSKILTQGLCGSFDGNQNNDLFNRLTNETLSTNDKKVIYNSTAASWRLDRITLSVIV